MEKDRYESFGDFRELSNEKQAKLVLYKRLNEIIQKDKVEPDLVNNSALKILLDTGKEDIDWNDYSEMDYQVKLLIEEHKLSVNKIYEFVDTKFPFKKQAYIDIFNKMEFIPKVEVQKIIDTLFEKEKSILIIKFTDNQGVPIDIYTINFNINGDFVENLEKFKTKAGDINVAKYGVEKLNLIQVHILISG